MIGHSADIDPIEIDPEIFSNPELIYAKAWLNADKQLQEIIEQEKQLAFKKAQLRETMKALAPLFNPKPTDISSFTLPNAIRLIVRSAGKPLSALEFKSKLEDLGYPLDKFENPLASIHTALKRMTEAEELALVPDKKKKFEPGPELKPTPETTTPNAEAISALIFNEQDKQDEEKK